ncbi:hypothetical protein O6H91_17G017400 [Diphasiastrum complanatum]|uniref:Uncharacterized protein n=1 Tax=Diphasiastrum complanatum TaxID=34168 RepID=A0ACC2B4K2_DIPCM|nr:hypothetical protein O6H91_17G017400 [Diphasiastrum complanatum]
MGNSSSSSQSSVDADRIDTSTATNYQSLFSQTNNNGRTITNNTVPAAAGEKAPSLSSPYGINRLADGVCASHYAASLKCLDDANYDKSKCQDRFDAYKDCKKMERKLRLEKNRKG